MPALYSWEFASRSARAGFSSSGSGQTEGGAATSITFSGPGAGTTGAPSAYFSATANGSVTGTVTVTPADGGAGGTFTPSSVALTTGTPSAVFTYTAATDGVKTLTISHNGGGGLAIVGSPRSYTASAAQASADWVARSTANGVVWAHDFSRTQEITAHLYGAPTVAGVQARTIIAPHRVLDESGIYCMQQIIIGGKLAQPYTAGSPTMEIVDDTYWPDPAVTGSFYVQVSSPTTGVPDKNLFQVTARNGRTLSVTYFHLAFDGMFTGVQESYAAGAHIGNEEMQQWVRPFSAMPAGENGLLVNDRADGGAVPVRSRLATGTYGVPRDLDLWSYGNYGHPSNQTTWQNWTPWIGAETRTTRGPVNGPEAKYGLWDGDEFFLQFRVKMDLRFLLNQRYAEYPWGRKTWAAINELSTYNELVTGYSAGDGLFNIPSTKEPMFSISTNKASAVIGRSDTTRAIPSDQWGSAWHVPPYYADPSLIAPMPSTGQATPDGSAAWEVKDNEWITFYMRVKPGRSAVAETEIEIKFARTEDPNYNGAYTTVLNVTDAKITYSGTGDYLYPDGSFSYPTVAVMNALPGFQAFWLFGYLNVWQSWNIPPPPASYYYRMGQVIFSRQPIAPPQPEAVLPSWTPAAATAVRYTAGGGVLANNFRSVIAPWFEEFYDVEIIGNSYSGATLAPDLGTHGASFYIGGGHSATNNGQATALVATANALTFTRLSNPTAWSGSRATDGPNKTYNSFEIGGIVGKTDPQWLDALPNVDPADASPQPPGLHSYSGVVVIPKAYGGAQYGTYFQIFPAAAAVGNLNGSGGHNTMGGSHSLALNSDSAPASNVWSRTGSLPGFTTQGWNSPNAAFVPHQNRVYYTALNTGGSKLRWFDLSTGQHVVHDAGGFQPDLGELNSGQIIYVPERRVLLFVQRSASGGSPRVRVEYMDVMSTSGVPASGGFATLGTVLPVKAHDVGSYWNCAFWCPHNKRLIVGGVLTGIGSSTFDNAFFEIEIPDTLGSSWPVTRRPILGSAAIDWNGNTFQPLVYLPKARAAVLFQFAKKASDGSGLDEVIVYRPHGT